MGQRARILSEIFGFRGWKVKEAFFEDADGQLFFPLKGMAEPVAGARLVLRVVRRWGARCSSCGGRCSNSAHENLKARRWKDLPWAGWTVEIEYEQIRVKCKRCSNPVEMVAWAAPRQRQSRRLQQTLALTSASMPTLHVAAIYGLSWGTVRRAEEAALARWDATRPEVPLEKVGIDEKYLGRRHKLDHKFVTIISNLETGEPVWIGPGRSEATVEGWLATLSEEQKAAIKLFAMDMHKPFFNAIRADPVLKDVPIVHDSFHLMKRAGKALDEMRREYFFRGGGQLRAVGRGTRWLVLRAWEHCDDEQQDKLKELFAYNPRLGRVYQVVEEYRELVCRAPDREAMEVGLARILRRTQQRHNVPLRKWHDSLREHREEILALAEHRPPTGRIEALNTNWESAVRHARGYRNYNYLLLKLRFTTANPIRNDRGVERFLSLGLTPPQAA